MSCQECHDPCFRPSEHHTRSNYWQSQIFRAQQRDFPPPISFAWAKLTNERISGFHENLKYDSRIIFSNWNSIAKEFTCHFCYSIGRESRNPTVHIEYFLIITQLKKVHFGLLKTPLFWEFFFVKFGCNSLRFLRLITPSYLEYARTTVPIWWSMKIETSFSLIIWFTIKRKTFNCRIFLPFARRFLRH